MPAIRTHKPRPEYLQPVHQPKEFPYFEPVPAPQPADTTLALSAILGADAVAGIQAAGRLIFHSVGDTGGVNGTDMQEATAEAMEAQIPQAPAGPVPSFFYHLGDVVYFNGLSSQYQQQFYEPYKFYPAPIMAIPGNHDGDVRTRSGDPPDNEPSLFGFMATFCDSQRRHVDPYRDTMTQPYVYWTLDAPFATIIGLYGNVDGELDGTGTQVQQRWLTAQLSAADPAKCLIVAVHQPPYSLDGSHGGYPAILDAIDQAAAAAGIWPHAVLSGHVHNYQRFARRVAAAGGERAIPYVVAGGGGYANTVRAIHKLLRNPAKDPVPCPVATLQDGVELRAYDETEPGYLRLTVTADQLTIEYFPVPFTGPAQNAPADFITIDYRAGAVIAEQAPAFAKNA